MKQLLIRADDLGYSEAVTLGIISAIKKGLVQSTAVMVNMDFAKEGLEIIKGMDNVAVGLHVNLSNGKALCSKEDIPSLVEDNGIFVSSKIRRQQIKNKEEVFPYDEVYKEAKKQLELFIEYYGSIPDYIDVHVFEVPAVTKVIDDIAQEYHIKECVFNYPQELKDRFNKYMMNQYKYYDEGHHDNLYHIFDDTFIIEEGINLMVTHPGFIDYYLKNNSSLCENRLYDYALLTDPKTKEYLKKNNVEIINFKNIKKDSV